ncbi:MAG: hypothetical protein M0R74_18780, partial [Dehalococcoidia bacterium]|nr:hypothetical protein [Dehalococcoidia bacterium]
MTENLPPNTDLPVDSQPLGTNDPQIAPGKPSQKRALFIGAAALVGVAVVAAAIIIPITMASESRKSQIVDAVEVCGVEAGTYAILDDGNAVDFDAAGLIIGADIDDVFCVLDELGAPQSIESKI